MPAPYHNPATMRHSVHNIDISKPLAHTTPYTLSGFCRYSWNRASSVKSTLLQDASGHQRWAFAHWSRLQHQTAVKSRSWWGWMARRRASLRWFLTVCAEILRFCKPTVSSVSSSSGEEARSEGPWLVWLHVVCVVRTVVHTAKYSKTTLETAYGRDINIQFSGNSSGGHSFSQHANCTLPQNLRHVTLCCVIKLHLLEWPIIVPQHKVHLCNYHAL